MELTGGAAVKFGVDRQMLGPEPGPSHPGPSISLVVSPWVPPIGCNGSVAPATASANDDVIPWLRPSAVVAVGIERSELVSVGPLTGAEPATV